ncbi:helix-turn-helix domain-containing protein [Endozoicomonas sp.]
MEKAKALLTHTDLPIQLIAERVGYNDVSAFSRRFTSHFGLSPKAFTC